MSLISEEIKKRAITMEDQSKNQRKKRKKKKPPKPSIEQRMKSGIRKRTIAKQKIKKFGKKELRFISDPQTPKGTFTKEEKAIAQEEEEFRGFPSRRFKLKSKRRNGGSAQRAKSKRRNGGSAQRALTGSVFRKVW